MTTLKDENVEADRAALTSVAECKCDYSIRFSKNSAEKEEVDEEFGEFCRGSFAEKMMLKMGWKAGQGLGKYNQGMLNPVKVKEHSKGVGLGVQRSPAVRPLAPVFPKPPKPAQIKIDVQPKKPKAQKKSQKEHVEPPGESEVISEFFATPKQSHKQLKKQLRARIRMENKLLNYKRPVPNKQNKPNPKPPEDVRGDFSPNAPVWQPVLPVYYSQTAHIRPRTLPDHRHQMTHHQMTHHHQRARLNIHANEFVPTWEKDVSSALQHLSLDQSQQTSQCI